MKSLNYHHLRLFRAVAREGNLTRASGKLHLTPQTVSTQIRDLEAEIGEQLFEREGRRLHLTETGAIALRYADEIFSLGQELQETLRSQPTERARKIRVGATDVLPKLIVQHLIEPALHLEDPVLLTQTPQLSCSSVVWPGRFPPSTSAWATQFVTDCTDGSNSRANDAIDRPPSRTSPTSSARYSPGYGPRVLPIMTPSRRFKNIIPPITPSFCSSHIFPNCTIFMSRHFDRIISFNINRQSINRFFKIFLLRKSSKYEGIVTYRD